MAPLRTILTTILLLFGSLAAANSNDHGHQKGKWVDIWASMPQLTESANLPPIPFNDTGVVFQNSTIRQTVRVTLAAPIVRLQISNAFGVSDLPITSASIALPLNGSSGTSAVKASSVRPLTFSGGNTHYTIPQGALAVTDPVFDFPVSAGTIVTISLYLADGQTTNLITSHPGSRTTSYFVRGNSVNASDLQISDPSTQKADHWYFISTLSGYVAPPSSGSISGALAIVGDSITDGRGSTTNGNNRWPDVLSAHLQSRRATSGISVLNLAAGGNRVLHDGLGPNALSRIDRDVLGAGSVRYALVFEGVNDIGTAATDAASQQDVGARLIAAYEQIITRVHARGIPIFGATITPFSGPGQTYSDPEREKTRQRVNGWIRGSGRFDAVVDFDTLVRNATQSDQLSELYNVGDYLHLNPDGYKAMGEAVDLALFERFGDGVYGIL
ncbi:GDSL-like Lipase/Acylhydrolase [Truncatella angustata]|uniref:GDSL-like Lipase/Acylhydrolase n=1 Tax=Truncatella angustata TaxID=152316 RepID=A0A9P9A4I8_9PEZI|nr:GDSL-like Lipase/Acylhydrolase [Truncatella angustata]KAH6660335.1 GDSL-like Lipase/Acylhydrolase [Truncatella angustata]